MTRWMLIALTALCFSRVAQGDGVETFDRSNARADNYFAGQFTGNQGVIWQYAQGRDTDVDRGVYAINGRGLILSSAGSARLTSAPIAGGIHDFSVNLGKAFPGKGPRQVELFINGVSKGRSEPFDDALVHEFRVKDIDVTGNIIIELRNIGGKQIVLDDLTWSSMTSADDPNISFTTTLDFGEIDSGTVATQFLDVVNTGTSRPLRVTSLTALDGDTAAFHSLARFPLTIAPNRGMEKIAMIYAPGAVTGIAHVAVFQFESDDASDKQAHITLRGSTRLGDMSASEIQYSPDNAASPYNGRVVAIKGVVTYVDARGYMLSDAAGGSWSAVYVEDRYHAPDQGDELRLEARVKEVDGFTMLSDVSTYTRLSVSNALPPPITLSAKSAQQEQYEGVAVRIANVKVSREQVSHTRWEVTDGTNAIAVLHDPQRRLYRYVPRNGATLEAIQGVMWQANEARLLQVRDEDDFVGRPIQHYALRGLVITPDGPRTNWYVEVLDDTIVRVGPDAPATTVYDTQAVLFPGLLDTHNHPSWNTFPALTFADIPFRHRNEWARTPEYKAWAARRNEVIRNPAVQDFKTAMISKYGEFLELMAGCIAIQGISGNTEYAHPDFGPINLEVFPTRIASEVFPMDMKAAQRAEMKKRINGGAVKAYLIHLSEGTDEFARSQLDTWVHWGMLTKETAIIHGTPYGTNDLSKIAKAGASIVWAPKSNMTLYHGTADIPLYLKYGINVAIAPDWTPSGGYNMLEELGYAWRLNQSNFVGSLTPKDLVDMATINAARAVALGDHYGKIAPGYNAGLVVVPYLGGDPYLSLINARPNSVLLTIIDGTPRYGDAAIMAQMGCTGEVIHAWGTTKLLNLEFDHPFLRYGSQRFAAITSALANAHAALAPTRELTRDELQFLSLDLLETAPPPRSPVTMDQSLWRIWTNAPQRMESKEPALQTSE